jgi:hypothetical protein
MNTPDPVACELIVREVDDAVAAEQLFRRRFGDAPPSFPHHVVTFHVTPAMGEEALCYIHFTAMDGLMLGGGAVVDNRAMRRLDPVLREKIRRQGGLYRLTLAWAVRHFAPSHDAIFGYCGDALAERIDLDVGFVRTAHPHLLVYWAREIDAARRSELVARAHEVRPF